jgi:hypothetical protein
MNVIVTHIFREGNDSADSLANAGLIINDIMYFGNLLPVLLIVCIGTSLGCQALDLHLFRGFGLAPTLFGL